MRKISILLMLALLNLIAACKRGDIVSSEEDGEKQEQTRSLVEISTREGDIFLMLYDQTPQHKENFLKLAREGFYDSTTFHRVIDGFMIQGGDPNSKDDNLLNDGQGGPGYTVPAEISDSLEHHRGAVAAARLGDNVNPERASSGSQFYIVENHEGTHFLDNSYTVFGQVVAGFDVVDSIAALPKHRSGNQMLKDQPRDPVYMEVSVHEVTTDELLERAEIENLSEALGGTEEYNQWKQKYLLPEPTDS